MIARQLPSGNWTINVYVGQDPETGKEIRKRFTGPDKKKVTADAAAWANEHRNIYSATSFNAAMKSFFRLRASSLSPSTMRGYKNIESALKRSSAGFLEMNIYNISSATLQGLVDRWLQEGASPKTIKNRIGFIAAVMNMYDLRRPMVRLPQTPLPDLNIPDSVTVRRTLQAAEKDRELWICIMLAATGPLREGEIAALTMDDIDFEANVIHVRHSMVRDSSGTWHVKMPKTRSSDRFIVMPEQLIHAIKEQGYVTHWVPTQIAKHFLCLLKRAKIQPYRFHDLRHYCISEMLAQGIEEIYIIERSGHSSLGTMARYKHILNNHRRTVTEQILSNFEALTG